MTELKAQVMADQSTPWNVRGENVRIAEGDRRTPTAFVDLHIGQGWSITASLQVLRKRGFVLHLPVAADGTPGIRPSAELMAAMERAAAEALEFHPEVFEHLVSKFSTGKRGAGGKSLVERAA